MNIEKGSFYSRSYSEDIVILLDLANLKKRSLIWKQRKDHYMQKDTMFGCEQTRQNKLRYIFRGCHIYESIDIQEKKDNLTHKFNCV